MIALRWLGLATLSAALVSLAIGCGDDTGTGGTGAEGGQGGVPSEGGASCEDKGGQCLAVPEGFKGPIELHDDGIATCTNPAFEGGYEEGTITAADAECGCACQPSGCTWAGVAFGTTDCTGEPTSVTIDDGCVPLPAGGPFSSVTVTVSDAGTCENDAAPATIPPVAFDPKVDGCNVNLDLCDVGVLCFPESVKTYCIYSTTETACPAGFDESHHVYQPDDLTDTRDCSCTCTGDPTCDPATTLFSDDACATSNGTADDNCSNNDTQSAITALQVDDPIGSCGAPETEVAGGVTVTGPGVLVCCLSQ